MIESLSSIDGAGTAFVAGLVSSLHCTAMCGPVAILLSPRPGEPVSFITLTATYQICRIFAFTLGGIIAGGVGLIALDWVQIYESSFARFLPWLLVVFFLLLALRLDRIGLGAKLVGGLWGRLSRRFFKLPKPIAAMLAGLFTPFLPCGPLYLVLGLALMSQSPVRGGEFLLAYGFGTLPLLWFAQHQLHFWQQRVSPKRIDQIQRIFALLAAIVIALRLSLFNGTSSAGLFCGN